jgi:hypothetical protein
MWPLCKKNRVSIYTRKRVNFMKELQRIHKCEVGYYIQIAEFVTTLKKLFKTDNSKGRYRVSTLNSDTSPAHRVNGSSFLKSLLEKPDDGSTDQGSYDRRLY